ncbi:phosphoribosylformimino-5-aminoimidazole carboxamide ribotide isomerase [Rhodanobacter sp. ANJX3]|uniref:TonB-dependent receptor n=1 Tax=Rhodanobacter sp. ANJX3 TaxID=2723083 RepID=UPI001615411A|nr:TonB-dependent receptor [Rhodanobacter sp. ANJX3]MBB5358888.1 phosphoribosylformimino-5-aminoimidazole carboxamide ribotide isomerase [Rhodanobacter sp. ANJX3]
MLLKRNVMAVALISAGLFITATAYATPGDSATKPGTTASVDTSASPAATPQDDTTDTKASAAKKAKDDSDAASPSEKKKLAKSLSAITVTGFSSSIEKSIDYQRYADNIQNVVTAADIGGLPDQSIADALTRLPGVAAERISGQASQINVRGLDGNFVLTTLNGRVQPSTSGSNYTDFDQYPSELINMATVYKSSQASLVEGGVGATIDMGTANPLENTKEQSLNIDARGSYDGQAHDVTGANSLGYRLSAAWQGKFLNDTLGVGLGFAQLYQPHVSEQFVGESYDSSPFTGQASAGSLANQAGKTTVVGAAGQNVYVPDGIQLQQNGGEEKRTGYLSTIVWKPTDHLQITGDSFFSKFNNSSFGYGFRSQQFDYGNTLITNPVLGANGSLLGATVSSNANGAQGNQFSNETTLDNYTKITNVFSGGLNLKWNDGPWHVDMDASLSHASSNQINVDATADPYNNLGTANPTLAAQSVTYRLNGSQVGTASFANPGMYTNLNDMALSRYGVYPYVYHDREKAFRTSVKYDFLNNPVVSALEAGVYLDNHTYQADRSVYAYGSEWNVSPVAGEPPLRLNSNNATPTCWQGKFGAFPCFLQLNGPAILAANGITNINPVKDWNNSWTEIQSGSVNEKSRDLFVMADIDTQVFDHQLTGNVGVRVARFSQYSDGIQPVAAGTGDPITDGYGVVNRDYHYVDVGKTYTDYLPSLNLAYHLTDSDQMRFSAGKVLSHPPIETMLAGAGSYITNNNTYNIYGSTSPYLNPLRARQYDLTYEHYFDDSTGVFVADAFFKHIDSFVQTITYSNFDFSTIGIVVPTDPATGKPYLNGDYQTSYNAKGGDLRGVELDYQKTHILPGVLSGLGIQLNYAYTQNSTKAESTLGGAPQQQGLPGYSRKVASAALFYDLGPFSARISGNYRSSFVSNSQIAVTNQVVYFAPETVFDFQASYKVNKDFSLVYQLLNLTNQPTRTYFGNSQETGTIQYFGRTSYFGFNLTF